MTELIKSFLCRKHNMSNFFVHKFPVPDMVDGRWIKDLGNEIEKPTKVNDERLNPIMDWFAKHQLTPTYTVITSIPAGVITDHNVDNKHKTAINVPIQGCQISSFQYMAETHEKCCNRPKVGRRKIPGAVVQALDPNCEEGEIVVKEEIKTTSVLCMDVSKEHRINNLKGRENRVVLSFGFTESVTDIFKKLN